MGQLITRRPEIGHYVYFTDEALDSGIGEPGLHRIRAIEYTKPEPSSERWSKVGNFGLYLEDVDTVLPYHFTHFVFDTRLISNGASGGNNAMFANLHDKFIETQSHLLSEERQSQWEASEYVNETIRSLKEQNQLLRHDLEQSKEITRNGQLMLKELVFEMYQRGLLVMKD